MLISLCLVLGQASSAADPNSKILPPRTRPYVELALTKGRPFISVSEHVLADPKTKKKTTCRVYRFTYRADYADEVKRWEGDFVKRGGWKLEERKPNWIIIGRPVTHAKVREQALILHPGKIDTDASQPMQTRTSPHEKNWVWVSYNEIFKGR